MATRPLFRVKRNGRYCMSNAAICGSNEPNSPSPKSSIMLGAYLQDRTGESRHEQIALGEGPMSFCVPNVRGFGVDAVLNGFEQELAKDLQALGGFERYEEGGGSCGIVNL
jgi:hypothetical protein